MPAAPPDPLAPPTPAAPPPDAAVEAAGRVMAEVKRRRAGIDRAAVLARISGWSLGVFASITGLLALAAGFDPAGLLLATGLGAASWLESRGRTRLLALDPGGARLLANNQLLIGGLILAWCGFNAGRALLGGTPYAEDIAATPELAPMLGDLGGLIRTITVGVYGIAGVVGAGFQVWAWRFHRKRVEMIEEMLRDTPAWARGG